MSDPPQVLNKQRDRIPAGAIYCGRPSPFGNPFRVGCNGSRATVVARYERWIAEQPHLLARLEELRGRDLVCWWAPLACLCDVLLKLANPTFGRDCKSSTPVSVMSRPIGTEARARARQWLALLARRRAFDDPKA